MPALMIALLSLFSLMFRTDDPAPAADEDRPLTRADLRRQIKAALDSDDRDRQIDRLAGVMKDNQTYRQTQHRLTDDEFKAWQQWQALGSPAEIKNKLDQVDLLNQRVAAIDKAEKIKRIAAAAKVANSEALAGLMADREFEIVPIQQPDGSTIDQVLVIDGTTKTPIQDFVKKSMPWAESVLFPANPPAAQGAAALDTSAAQGATQSPAGAAQGAAPVYIQAGNPPAAQGAAVNASAIAQQFNEARSAGVKNPLAPKA